MTKCTSIVGHRYQPRYDSRETERDAVAEASSVRGTEAMRILCEMNRPLVAKTYRGDVCVRCGDVVNRNNQSHD